MEENVHCKVQRQLSDFVCAEKGMVKNMNYRIENIDIQKAYQSVFEYDYALIYMMSKLILSKTSDLGEIDWDECLEARFFSKEKELHIFEDDGEQRAVEVRDMDEKDSIVKKYQLAKQFSGLGNTLCVKEYLAYDEDGQTYVSLTRLTGIE